MNLPLLSHLLATTAYACVALLLLPSRHAHRSARVAALGLAATALWALAVTLDAGGIYLPARLFGVLDAMRYAAWFAVLRTLAGVRLAPWLARGSYGVCVALILLTLLLPERVTASWVNAGGVLLALIGLVQLEQLLRNTSPALRNAMKLATVGVGGQFALDLFLYSQGEWIGGVGPGLAAARGLVFVLLLPVVVLAVHRAAASAPVVFVSRHMVFYASSVIVIGAYLGLTALGGFYLRARGGSWGGSLQLIFLCGAAAALAALLLSNNLWRRLKVFIATHFYRGKYDYRVEWLRFIQTLSSGNVVDAPRTAIVAVAQMFQSPGGVLFMRDEETTRFAPVAAWPRPELRDLVPSSIEAGEDLPQLLAERHWVIDVEEYLANPAIYGNMDLPLWLRDALAWRVVTPLLHLDRLVGFIVLQPPPPPFLMNFEDRDLFKTVGRHIALLLAQRSADHKLTESRQFDAYNRFSAFVMHDLKNAVAQLQLLVQNAARHRDNPQFFDDAISTISNSVDRMTRLIGQLQARDVHGHLREIVLAPVVDAAVARARGRLPAPSFEDRAAATVVRADPEKLGSVLDHVIRNAQEATGERGTVEVRLAPDARGVRLTVRDDGPGMDAEFMRERLFRPFDSTKGSKGMGIGAYQTREYVRQLGGHVEVISSPGQGTTFCITLPLWQRKNPDY